MFSLGMNLLFLIGAIYIPLLYPAQLSVWTMLMALLVIAFATTNLAYWIYRFRPVRSERDQFLKDHGWNYKNKVQGYTKLWFKPGQGKADLFFFFVVNSQPEAYRISVLTHERINEKYLAYYKEDICIIKDFQTESMSLYRKMK